jgi:hypothetical protein
VSLNIISMKSLRMILIVWILFTGCNKEDVPVVTTADVTSVTQTSATCGGEVISQGDSEITEKGICWSTSDNPTILDSITVGGSGIEGFTCNLVKLNPGTEYFVRAYAINSSGTGYGETKSFTTEPATIPEVTGGNITSITLTSATINGGTIISNGGLQIIDRGFCWNTIGNPTLSDNFVSLGAGSDTFSTTITGLEPNTCYYLLAYATNLAGTGYGRYDRVFPTLFPETPVYPSDSIFGKWKLIYSVGGIGGDIMPSYYTICIDEYRKDSVNIYSCNGIIDHECKFSVKGNVLKYSNMDFFYKIMIRGDNMITYLFDTLGYDIPMDYIWARYFKLLKLSN